MKLVKRGYFISTLLAAFIFSSIPSWSSSINTSNDDMSSECFLVMAGKNMTGDGSILIAHCEDDWTGVSSRLTRVERRKNISNDSSLQSLSLPQPAETYAYWAQGVSSESSKKNNDAWILNGMNEHGVVVTCNIMNECRETILPEDKGMSRFAIRKLILERAKTAREGLEIIGNIIDTKRLSGKVVAFCLADSDEIWLIETTPSHWVAKKIASDQYHIEPNHYTIGKEWDLASKDLASYAQKRGWYNEEDGEFSFKDAYADPSVFSDPFNAARVYQAECILDNECNKIIDISVLKSIVSQPPVMDYRNQATFIWQLRGDLPAGVGNKMWFGFCGAAINGMAPVYAASKKVPDSYHDSPAAYDGRSDFAYWHASLLQRKLNPGLWGFGKDFLQNRLILDRFQSEIEERTGKIEAQALDLYAKGKIDMAEELLSSHTESELNRISDHADKMLTKFGYK